MDINPENFNNYKGSLIVSFVSILIALIALGMALYIFSRRNPISNNIMFSDYRLVSLYNPETRKYLREINNRGQIEVTPGKWRFVFSDHPDDVGNYYAPTTGLYFFILQTVLDTDNEVNEDAVVTAEHNYFKELTGVVPTNTVGTFIYLTPLRADDNVHFTIDILEPVNISVMTNLQAIKLGN